MTTAPLVSASSSSSAHVPARRASARALDAARRFCDGYLLMLALLLAGYALDDRGFAYIGFPPIFVGEIGLLLGVVAFGLTPRWRQLLARAPVTWAMLAFCGWGMARTLPFLGQYQLDALRDAVAWGYAAFAFIVAALLTAEPTRLTRLLAWYRRFIPIFLCAVPVMFIAYRFFWPDLPRWPWATVPVLFVKEADVMVHLGGIFGFWTLISGRRVGWVWLALMALNIGITAVIDRSGAVAFGAVAAVCVLARPRSGATWRLVLIAALGFSMLWVTSFRYEIPGGKGREVSIDQFVTNLASITGGTGHEGLDGTKEWRLDWWRTIIDYTIHGKYFWGGKGFGINLADDDGFQVGNGTLRAPHNYHMTVLARMGVIGVALWLLVLITWTFAVLREAARSSRSGHRTWCGLFLFLAAFCAAFLINGAFDVYLEGPPGGIWFWCVFGVGIAAVHVHQDQPELLDARARNHAHDGDADDADATAIYTEDIVLMLDHRDGN